MIQIISDAMQFPTYCDKTSVAFFKRKVLDQTSLLVAEGAKDKRASPGETVLLILSVKRFSV